MITRRTALLFCLALVGPSVNSPCWSASARIDGASVRDVIQVDGTTLVLNGAGYRKRGYHKYCVQAVYIQERRTTLEGVIQQAGTKRIALHVLRDIPGSLVAKHFVSDLQEVMTEAERKSLVTEIGLLGGAFGSIYHLNKGDIINIDYLPSKGIAASLNDKPIALGDGTQFLRSEELYRVLIKLHAGTALSEELQQNMLGTSRSMWTDTTR